MVIVVAMAVAVVASVWRLRKDRAQGWNPHRPNPGVTLEHVLASSRP
jgi:hypothetical protein